MIVGFSSVEAINDLDKEYFSGVTGTKGVTGMSSKENIRKRIRDS